MKRILIVHYGEIGLKRANKPYFVEKLRKHLKYKLEKKFREVFVVKHVLSRFMIELPEGFLEEEYVKVVGRIFGVKNFKFSYVGSVDLEELGEQIVKELPEERPGSFRVKVKRSMTLDMKSIDYERELGAIVLRSGFEVPVKMKGAELVIDVELFNEKGYFSMKKYKGAGGLSANSQGKLICLMSSGIDSPVAAYMMMRRGARVIFAHFHGYPYTDKDEMEQVQELVEILSDYQFDTKLYLVPFGFIQKAIATNLDIPGKVRTVLYRRIMLKISEEISRKEKANGLITGESFGQVASQTPGNIFAIHDAVNIPILPPLIGMDKDEVIAVAERIGTFDISKLPCKDACSSFMPKSPELNANVYDLHKYEESLPLSEWIEKALGDAEVKLY